MRALGCGDYGGSWVVEGFMAGIAGRLLVEIFVPPG